MAKKQQTATPKKSITYFVLGLHLDGVWRLSKTTTNLIHARIRYLDIRTIWHAALLTPSQVVVDKVHGQHARDVKKYIMYAVSKKAATVGAGIPMEDIKRNCRPEVDVPVKFDGARGCTEVDGNLMRPGFAANYWRDSRGVIYSTSLLPAQQKLFHAQRAARREAGMAECARV